MHPDFISEENIGRFVYGIVLDTCILFRLHEKEKFEGTGLTHVLSFFKNKGINLYYPRCIEHECKSIALKDYRAAGLLQDIEHNQESLRMRSFFTTYPLQDGELECFSIADAQRFSVATEDKLPSFSYVVAKNINNIKENRIDAHEIYQVYSDPVFAIQNNFLPRFNHKNLLDISRGKKVFMHGNRDNAFLRPGKWLEKNQYKFTESLFKIKAQNRSPQQISFSQSLIGAIFSSLWACKYEVNPNYDIEDYNIGLVFKSEKHKKFNLVLANPVKYSYQGKDRLGFCYSPAAYEILLKYFRENPWLYDFLQKKYKFKSRVGFISDKKKEKKAIDFSGKVRKLFKQFKRKVVFSF